MAMSVLIADWYSDTPVSVSASVPDESSASRLALVELEVPGYIHKDAPERVVDVADECCVDGGGGFHTYGLSHGLHSL